MLKNTHEKTTFSFLFFLIIDQLTPIIGDVISNYLVIFIQSQRLCPHFVRASQSQMRCTLIICPRKKETGWHIADAECPTAVPFSSRHRPDTTFCWLGVKTNYRSIYLSLYLSPYLSIYLPTYHITVMVDWALKTNNQSTYQSINQSFNQSTNQSI